MVRLQADHGPPGQTVPAPDKTTIPAGLAPAYNVRMLIHDRRVLLPALFVCATVAGACQSTSKPAAPAAAPSAAPDVWATVDGREIKQEAIERAFRRTVQPGQPLFTLHAQAPGELAYAQQYIETRPPIFQISEAS